MFYQILPSFTFCGWFPASAFKSLFSLCFLNCSFCIWGSQWLYQKLSRQQGVNLDLKKKKENPQYLILSLVQKEGKNPKPLNACSEAAVSSPVGFVCKSFHTKRSWKYINRTFPRLKYLGCYFLLCPNWCFFVKFPREKNAVRVFGFFPTLMSQCPTLCFGIYSTWESPWRWALSKCFPLSPWNLESQGCVTEQTQASLPWPLSSAPLPKYPKISADFLWAGAAAEHGNRDRNVQIQDV